MDYVKAFVELEDNVKMVKTEKEAAWTPKLNDCFAECTTKNPDFLTMETQAKADHTVEAQNICGAAGIDKATGDLKTWLESDPPAA